MLKWVIGPSPTPKEFGEFFRSMDRVLARRGKGGLLVPSSGDAATSQVEMPREELFRSVSVDAFRRIQYKGFGSHDRDSHLDAPSVHATMDGNLGAAVPSGASSARSMVKVVHRAGGVHGNLIIASGGGLDE